ncbi:class I adenylate-forming enzyme family protein [Halorarum salinum]|uniref:AMP-binding protein n=1 Tax=Halorarum salinum TaxID=2743089 RepID=A0A7D5QJ78_9EURY|nr:AMP-binding protein [Halobaculum salinum]QLG63902.1 AMP-binding protein [Halobaculum salinum]
MDVTSMFERSVSRTPDRDAVVDVATGERHTYEELAAEVESVAAGLVDRGIGPGDRVAVSMANRPEHAATFLATQRVGAVAVPFNFRLPADDVDYHLRDSSPSAFVFDDLSREAVERAQSGGGLDCGTRVHVGDDTPSFAEPYGEFRGGSLAGDAPEVGPDDPSVILYTSGTTGDPKGIPISREATVARTLSNSLGQGYYLRETMLGVMPLYHTVGLHGILCSMMAASGTYLCMPEFDPGVAVRTIDAEGVTALHEAPTIFRHMLNADAVEGASLDTVATVAYSGAPMDRTLFEAVDGAFDPERFTNVYGNTETYDPLEFVDLRTVDEPTVVGNSHTFHRTRIVDLDAADPAETVAPGVEGELVVHTDSPASFSGYLNEPEETRKAIVDGWYFTGDAAYEREDGNVVVTGRADDLVISGGENVHPAEVEDVLTAHADVTEVGVVGSPSEEWGEIVKAYVDGDATAEVLDEWCREHDGLADFKRPREYEFVEKIPRNPSGKIMRYRLRQDDG